VQREWSQRLQTSSHRNASLTSLSPLERVRRNIGVRPRIINKILSLRKIPKAVPPKMTRKIGTWQGQVKAAMARLMYPLRLCGCLFIVFPTVVPFPIGIAISWAVGILLGCTAGGPFGVWLDHKGMRSRLFRNCLSYNNDDLAERHGRAGDD